MLDAKPILDKWLSAEEYKALSETVANAYRACDEFFHSNVVTKEFPIGAEQRSYLINCFVQHALMKLANRKNSSFFYDIKPNAAQNCSHLRIYKNKLTITTHFLGRKSDRGKARTAKFRAALSSQNLDLFSSNAPATEKMWPSDHLYCQLLHGGLIRPDAVCLAIPTIDQTNISHSMPLPIVEPELTKAEQIREEMTWNLLSPPEQDTNDQTG